MPPCEWDVRPPGPWSRPTASPRFGDGVLKGHERPDLAPIKEQVYKDPRPKEHFDRFHQRTRTRDPDWVYEVVRLVTSLYAFTFFRARGISSEKVPASGPVILAPNHFSFMDHFFLGSSVRRKVRFMAKSQLFKPPLQWIYTHGGVFPVRRGHGDDEAFITARAVLARGGCVAMYCEGGRSRSGQLSEQPKRGIGRLALESGAVVVPVAIHGSSHVRNWKRGRFPKVTVQFGDPIRWEQVDAPTRDQQQAVANDIFAQIRGLYANLDALGRKAVMRRVGELRRAGATAVGNDTAPASFLSAPPAARAGRRARRRRHRRHARPSRAPSARAPRRRATVGRRARRRSAGRARRWRGRRRAERSRAR
jgi:1-acyl-sn-glycerol-3-phosphate acyltransferase